MEQYMCIANVAHGYKFKIERVLHRRDHSISKFSCITSCSLVVDFKCMAETILSTIKVMVIASCLVLPIMCVYM